MFYIHLVLLIPNNSKTVQKSSESRAFQDGCVGFQLHCKSFSDQSFKNKTQVKHKFHSGMARKRSVKKSGPERYQIFAQPVTEQKH